MTSLIGLALALYFGPTQEQVDYCLNVGWSYEIIIINNQPVLPEEAKAKAKICEKILKLKEVQDGLKWY